MLASASRRKRDGSGRGEAGQGESIVNGGEAAMNIPGGHIPGERGRRDRHKAALEAKFNRGEVGEGADPLGRADR